MVMYVLDNNGVYRNVVGQVYETVIHTVRHG
jgi:hypothetical protein